MLDQHNRDHEYVIQLVKQVINRTLLFIHSDI